MKTAKVIRVSDDMTVVINIGAQDGVKNGDFYLIYEMGEELFDLDTNVSLGQLEIVKGKGKVTHVQERFSTIKSIEERKNTQKKTVTKPSLLGLIDDDIVIEETFDIVELPFEKPKLNDLAKKINLNIIS